MLELLVSNADSHPIRRLVVTGKDTNGNMQLLFGPNWREIAKKIHTNARMEVLMQPRPRSEDYELYKRWDEGAPTWAPKPASAAELEEMANVKDMQGERV